MLAARANDGRFGPFTPVIGTTPGVWRPTPPLFAARPRSLGRQRTTVPGPRRRDAPHRRAERPDQPRLRQDFNEVKKIGSLHSTTRTADQTDAAIFWQDHAFAPLEPRVPHPRRLPAPGHRRQRTALREREPGRRRCRDRLLEQQVPLELLAPDHRHPRGRERRKPGNQGRPDMDAAVRSVHAGGHAPRARHAAVPRVPLGPQLRGGSIVANAAVLLRHRQDRLQRVQQQDPRPPGPSTASPTHSRRTSTPASGPGSTSAPPTSRAPGSARRSRATSTGTTSNPSTDQLRTSARSGVGGRRSLATVEAVRIATWNVNSVKQRAAAAAALAGRAAAGRRLPAGDQARRRRVHRAARRRARRPRLRGRGARRGGVERGGDPLARRAARTSCAGLAGGPGFPHPEARAVSATCGGIRVRLGLRAERARAGLRALRVQARLAGRAARRWSPRARRRRSSAAT